MRIGATSWMGMALAGAAIYLGAGCGGSLSGGTGGTDGVGSGMAGTNSPPTSGVAAASGTAGTTGTAGGPGGAGGSPYEGTTTWVDVTVRVAATNLASGTFTLQVVDPTVPDTRLFHYPPATRFSPNHDGAYLTVRYTCGGPAAVDQVAVYSCADDGVAGGTRTPGCIGVTFDQRGPMGNFEDTDGTSCSVTSGSASFQIPPPGFSAPPVDASTPDAAVGSFSLDCARPDGTHLNLNAHFVIPFESRILLCLTTG
jgi:hypothetical protein